jgi:cell division protein FtsW
VSARSAAAARLRGRGRPADAKAGPRRAKPPIEYQVLKTATLCLLAVGAVMVYSASSARNLLQGGGDGTGFLLRYIAFGALGLVAMHVLSRRGAEAVRNFAPMLLAVAFVCCLLVLVPGLGVEVNGARRWLGAGPLQFQPSELLKLALVLYGAAYLAQNPKRVQRLGGLLSPMGLVFGAAFVIVGVHDLGTALVISATFAAICVAGGVPIRHLAIIGAVGGGLILLAALAEPYRVARLTSFIDPWSHAGGAGFQAVQGQIALGSGGLFGVGLGQSVQKVFYLPEAHTDFILAVIGEELGVAGLCGVVALYGMILWAGLRTARKAAGTYAKLLAAGLTSLILCQATLNMFVVLGLAPLTGVPLPLISYGQTNALILLSSVGVLLNIAAGNSVKLRVVEGEGRDRRRRDGGPRRAGAGGRRRATG